MSRQSLKKEIPVFPEPIAAIDRLGKIYSFANQDEIRDFILKNSYLIEILMEAPGRIYNIFGQVPLFLELHRDPEEGWDELFIVIKTSFSSEEAVILENRLMKEWFLDKLDETKGKLNIVEEPL